MSQQLNQLIHTFDIFEAESDRQIAIVRELLLEYGRALEFRICFQSFEQELAELSNRYGPPRGRLLLAMCDNEPAGCVAIQEIQPLVCEMKRLFVRPQFR